MTRVPTEAWTAPNSPSGEAGGQGGLPPTHKPAPISRRPGSRPRREDVFQRSCAASAASVVIAAQSPLVIASFGATQDPADKGIFFSPR